ncbi:venom peptide CtAPI-like [Colias croceus]|uniref:venom peptide CtAPI-like n=1 Tax=Colias crocea TaxID=72248 RepID=UPI001E27F426|nr:venom peptide CtAPI-like [Colias croceus]
MSLKTLPVLFLFIAVSYALKVDKTPWECPKNERYIECALEVCWKNCKDLKNPPPCPSIAAGCYDPACVCDNDYMRNDEGVCVPTDQC